MAAPAAAQAAPDLGQIEALLRDLTGKVDALQAENATLRQQVGQARAATPRIVKRPGEDRHNVAAKRAQFTAGMRSGEARGGTEQLPVDHLGKRIPDLADEYLPQFEPGDAVRLRRDQWRQGFKEGVTWGDVLDRVGADGVGVVLRQLNLTKVKQWKYVCHFPGLTRRERGDGFLDYELEPAA